MRRWVAGDGAFEPLPANIGRPSNRELSAGAAPVPAEGQSRDRPRTQAPLQSASSIAVISYFCFPRGASNSTTSPTFFAIMACARGLVERIFITSPS